MFITFNGLAHYMAEFSGHALLAMPGYRESTAQEAAECVNRTIINGDRRMQEINADFERIYGNPAYKPQPQACEVINLHREARDVEARIREANMAEAVRQGLIPKQGAI